MLIAMPEGCIAVGRFRPRFLLDYEFAPNTGIVGITLLSTPYREVVEMGGTHKVGKNQASTHISLNEEVQ
jgi:hypothetical protein